ncbi:MAG: hypothetical protein QOG35_1630 [Solirubrobacteraceae bacterium]|jgi:hypothetical protein|nr:hypothetical protein [Solirubrobacteraceae bacterium]
MELATITMDRNEARKAFLEYRDACRADRAAEDEALMRAYRAAAKGVALIRLSEVLAAGGTVEREITHSWWTGREERSRTFTVWLPALAVARADVTKVWCSGVRQGGAVIEYSEGGSYVHQTRKRFTIPDQTFPTQGWESRRHVAMAPNIPPALRPPHALHNYHLLWEAEWADVPEPPGDPALLKHLGGDLYAVLAAWDLTPIEQAVLAGTRA